MRRWTTAWRRLVAPPRPSPLLARFLELLSQTPYPWHLAGDGKLRAHEGTTELCAITGVVRHYTGVRFDVGDWVRAADRIGLSYREAGFVVEAADVAQPSGARSRRLRQWLLVAARIQDPLDRELADLFARAHRSSVSFTSTIETDGMSRMNPRKSRKNQAKLATQIVVSTTAGR